MKREEIEVKGKIGNKEFSTTCEYPAPENLQDGIKYDGEDKVFALYRNERKTQYMDKIRKTLLADETAKIAKIARALGTLDKAAIAKLPKELQDILNA